MRVYDIGRAGEPPHSFEVDSLLGRHRATRLVSKIPGARILKRPKLFSWFREDEFCVFELQGRHFCILEPFGDNSRYLVAQKEKEKSPEAFMLVRRAFLNYQHFLATPIWPRKRKTS